MHNRENNILMGKGSKPLKISPLSPSILLKLVSIEKKYIVSTSPSHQKEKLYEESPGVATMKSYSYYVFRYTKEFIVCASETGPLYNNNKQNSIIS